jgi:hypothetical protein
MSELRAYRVPSLLVVLSFIIGIAFKEGFSPAKMLTFDNLTLLIIAVPYLLLVLVSQVHLWVTNWILRQKIVQMVENGRSRRIFKWNIETLIWYLNYEDLDQCRDAVKYLIQARKLRYTRDSHSCVESAYIPERVRVHSIAINYNNEPAYVVSDPDR